MHEILKRLRELNLVRVHFDDDGALYEFGNQPHPVFVCVQYDRESARQDMLCRRDSSCLRRSGVGEPSLRSVFQRTL